MRDPTEGAARRPRARGSAETHIHYIYFCTPVGVFESICVKVIIKIKLIINLKFN